MSDKLTFQFNNKTLLGQMSGSVIEMPSIASARNIKYSDHPDSEEKKDKEYREFIEFVDAIRLHIEQLQRDIDKLEAHFRERDGEEWREKLALKILDADDIPQRRSDETIVGYRERLEPILITQMLNADGSIKGQYLNDLDLIDYAEWAQQQYNLSAARDNVLELEDPNTPQERKNQIYDELQQSADIEKIVLTAYELSGRSEVKAEIKDAIDTKNIDESSEIQMADTVSQFLKPLS